MVVEEGFLDGLDLSLAPGLNVLIGPRGVGKTSVIELLRYCLAAPALTERFERSAREHALSVLGEGRVSVSYRLKGETFTLSRRASDERPEGDSADSAHRPIVLSQNEIEAVGLDARGRLRIIDGFRADSTNDTTERSTISAIRSLATEVRELDVEIERFEGRVAQLKEVEPALTSAESELRAMEATVESAGAELRELDTLATSGAQRSVRIAALDRTREVLADWGEQIASVSRAAPPVEDWPDDSPNPIEAVRQTVEAARRHLTEVEQEVEAATRQLEQRLVQERKASTADEDRARDLRRRAEDLREGAGAAARRVTELREQVAQLQALRGTVAERRSHLAERRRLLDEALTRLDKLREARFRERLAVAKELNDRLGPEIQVKVERSGMFADYAAAIADALRGSGLHYSRLAPKLAAQLAPRELAHAVETNDYQQIAHVGDIQDEERARRVIYQLRSEGIEGILAAPLEDAVEFSLLDGNDYKPTPELSTGQRCTVVLPILLQHNERPVIIDQPEDHLDNAFIVDTLVKAILAREPSSQLVVSTHNPNVPVIGDARQVTVLGSDGRRGFERHSGDLEDDRIVTAITSIMEGGREAFERRAEFYKARTE